MRLCSINLDGHVVYRYDISGNKVLAVDRQGNAYISGRDSNDIQWLSPDGTFRDIVLSKHDGVDGPFGITSRGREVLQLMVVIITTYCIMKGMINCC